MVFSKDHIVIVLQKKYSIFCHMIYLTRLKPQTIVYHLLPPQRPLHDALKVRGHQFQLPNCIYKFHKQSFIVSSLFRFLK